MATCKDDESVLDEQLLSINDVLSVFNERIAISSLKRRLLEIVRENINKKINLLISE